jgi:hypothetical protein
MKVIEKRKIMSNENYIIGLTLGLIIFGIALGIS